MDLGHGGDAQGVALAAPYGDALVERGALGGFQVGRAEEVGGSRACQIRDVTGEPDAVPDPFRAVLQRIRDEPQGRLLAGVDGQPDQLGTDQAECCRVQRGGPTRLSAGQVEPGDPGVTAPSAGGQLGDLQ